jgi:hypothetical protein
VQIDGAVVGTFTPASTSYANFTTTVFTLAAGVHTVGFVGLDPNGGDNTAFVDQVALTLQLPPSNSQPTNGHKLPVLGESHGHRSEPMGQAADLGFWTLYGGTRLGGLDWFKRSGAAIGGAAAHTVLTRMHGQDFRGHATWAGDRATVEAVLWSNDSGHVLVGEESWESGMTDWLVVQMWPKTNELTA